MSRMLEADPLKWVSTSLIVPKGLAPPFGHWKPNGDSQPTKVLRRPLPIGSISMLEPAYPLRMVLLGIVGSIAVEVR